jgi:hypothetical protein
MLIRLLSYALLFFSLTIMAREEVYLDDYIGELTKLKENGYLLNAVTQTQHTDNYLFNHDNAQDAMIFEIKPRLLAQYQKEKHMLQLGAWAVGRKIDNVVEKSTVDLYSFLKFHSKLSDSQSLVLSASYADKSPQRGTGISRGFGEVLIERDHKRSNFVNVAYQLGSENTNAQLTLLYGHRDLRYLNRKDITAELNSESNYYNALFDYYFYTDSAFSTEIFYESIKHDLSDTLDRNIGSALFGIKWDKSVFTSVDFLIGTNFISFEQGNLANDQNFKWDIEIEWIPLDYLKVELTSGRVFDETRQVGNSYLISDELNVALTYHVNDVVVTSLQQSYTRTNYIFEDDLQEEKGLSTSVGVVYKFRPRVNFSLSYTYHDVESDVLVND